MTKQEMIEKIRAEHPEVSSNQLASKLIDSVFGLIVAGLNAQTGDKKRTVRVLGLGVFSAAVTPERTARHPGTGEKMTVAPRVKFAFRPGAGVAESISMPLPKAAKPAKRSGTVAATAASVR